MQRKITKLALAVTLLMGQITHQQPSSPYYEEDSDFDSITTALSGGWGWGLNQAHAEDCSEYEYSEYDECMRNQEQGEGGVDEHIEVNGGSAPDSDPMDGYEWVETAEDSSGSPSGSDGGVVYGPAEPTPEEKQAAKEQCIAQAQQMGVECDASYAALNKWCDGLTLYIGGSTARVIQAAASGIGWEYVGAGGLSGSSVAGACAYLDTHAKAWCKAQTELKVKACG